jgi:fumarate hydratase class I
LEQLEENPGKYLPEVLPENLSTDVVKIDLNKPIKEVLAELEKLPIKTRVSLSGTLIVARDIGNLQLIF